MAKRLLAACRTFLVVLFLGVVLAGCTERAVLFNALTETEANEIYQHLLSAGIPAEKTKTKEGVNITVPKPMSAEALSLTQAKGLPRDKKKSLGDVFKKENMISSPLEERARYLYALSQELEGTLMQMDGVISAKVHIVLPERSTPGEPLSPSSAAVFIKYVDGNKLPVYVPKIREMIFKSIPGIIGDPQTSVNITAIPSEVKVDECIPLVWFGPIAMNAQDKGYFLFMTYLVLLLWGLSIAITWLQAKDVDQWPDVLKKIRERFVR
jgi:type III secretion protein J